MGIHFVGLPDVGAFVNVPEPLAAPFERDTLVDSNVVLATSRPPDDKMTCPSLRTNRLLPPLSLRTAKP